jgi:acyl-CoA reductase-like NAD-dependent aldehyde dehydrogenase
MAGNTVVLKHAGNVTGTARRLAEVIASSGAPASLLEVIVIGAPRVARVIADPRVAGVTLTGSEQAGIQVAGACAAVLKKSVLELGGSDPFVILEDADVEAAARAAVTGRFLNAGQSCIAAKRFIVTEAVADEFEQAFAAHAQSLVMGDPRTAGVELGPMARVDLRDELADQVRRALEAGGRLVCGGTAPPEPGAYYPPTIVADLAPSSPLAQEETFGPAAAILRVPDAASALAAANDSPYGLSASLWTADVDRVAQVAASIDSGAVFVNTTSASDPRMPFGGVKRSGWGRELGSLGIREFVNAQAVTVAPRG